MISLNCSPFEYDCVSIRMITCVIVGRMSLFLLREVVV